MNCNSWFGEERNVFLALHKELKEKQKGKKQYPKAPTNTRYRRVMTASVIIYNKYPEIAPIVITPKGEDQYIVEGI